MLSNKVTEIMTRELTTLPASSTIQEVMEMLAARDVDAVILTENNTPAGIFTERHVLKRVVNAALEPKTAPAANVMTAPIHAVSEDTPIVDALGEMFQRRIRHLLVRTEDNQKVAGIVSMRRILQMVVEIGHGVNETRTVGDIMSPHLLSVDPSMSVSQAIDLMIRNDSGAVVVTETDSPTGIFTERDVLRRVVLKDLDSRQIPIKEVMTSPVITMPRHAIVGKVLDEMCRRNIRNMPIHGERGEPAGLVSMPEVIQYARALDIDDAIRRSWKEIQQFYDSLDLYTPG
jgi:signal-transduction protein with cAMP-binding, CBS, and nucleotidyltransferase domain